MKGKLCVITGANCGIGLETARGIARHGATVVVTARDAQKGQEAVRKIKRSSPNSNIDLLLLDLASLSSIRKAAETLLRRHDRIDILINNAGLLSRERKETSDGFEMTLGVNHLGHFLLTNLLLERMKATAATHGTTRIVNVSSTAHRSSRGLDFEDLMYQIRAYRSFRAYCDSKLANILFTRELTRRLQATEIAAHALHPGLVRSRLARPSSLGVFWASLFRVLGLIVGVSARRGAETSLFVATSDQALSSRGMYWERSTIVDPELPENEAAVSSKLWSVSEQLTGLA